MSDRPECVDCAALPDDERPARPRPIVEGVRKPRCKTHARAKDKTTRAGQRSRYLQSTYNITDEFFAALIEHQGGACAWCGLAKGVTTALVVDHDHSCCAGPKSCGKCVRGALCHECNQFLGRRMRDNPEAIRRGARYLAEPPAQKLFMSWTPDTNWH